MTDPTITEEMLDAGARAFCETQSLDPRKLAKVVYTAMRSSEPMWRPIEETITAWAYAHNIDGAARNDLFKRLRTLPPPPLSDGE